MRYRQLDRTGLKVSELCLGTMTFGEQNSEAEGHAQMDCAVDCGINMFDAAEIYPVPPKRETQGRTESIIGTWLARQKKRDKVLVATKHAGRRQKEASTLPCRHQDRGSRNRRLATLGPLAIAAKPGADQGSSRGKSEATQDGLHRPLSAAMARPHQGRLSRARICAPRWRCPSHPRDPRCARRACAGRQTEIHRTVAREHMGIDDGPQRRARHA